MKVIRIEAAIIREAAGRVTRHRAALEAGTPRASPYWQGSGWISVAPGELRDLNILASAYLAQHEPDRPATEAEIESALDFGKTAEQHLR